MSGWAAAILAAGLLFLGCGSPYPGATLGQQVQSWMQTTTFAAGLSSLRTDARHIATIETRHDVQALHTDCDVLVDDALGANQNLPTPDTTLTTILSDAYTAAAQAGRRCASARSDDAAALAGAHADLGRAAAGYVRAEARIDAVQAPGAGG